MYDDFAPEEFLLDEEEETEDTELENDEEEEEVDPLDPNGLEEEA